jgi:hypothetical protein
MSVLRTLCGRDVRAPSRDIRYEIWKVIRRVFLALPARV